MSLKWKAQGKNLTQNYEILCSYATPQALIQNEGDAEGKEKKETFRYAISTFILPTSEKLLREEAAQNMLCWSLCALQCRQGVSQVSFNLYTRW